MLNGLGRTVSGPDFAVVDGSPHSLTLDRLNGKTLSAWVQSETTLLGLNGASPEVTSSPSGAFSSANLSLASGDGRARILYSNPAVEGWNYQTFGYWADFRISTAPMGGFSVGAATGASSIPATGQAVFQGQLVVFRPLTNFFAPMTLDVDFANRTANFDSGGWYDSFDTYPGKLTGQLSWNGGEGLLQGTLTRGSLSGPVTAQFYGPSAQEVGGVFHLDGVGLGLENHVVGSFGAKR